MTLRHGWVRWSELRTRIDAVDAWLKSPDPSRAKAVLREVMVDIPTPSTINATTSGR